MMIRPDHPQGIVSDEFGAGGSDRTVVSGPHHRQNLPSEKIPFTTTPGTGAHPAEKTQRVDDGFPVGPINFQGLTFFQPYGQRFQVRHIRSRKKRAAMELGVSSGGPESQSANCRLLHFILGVDDIIGLFSGFITG